MENLKVEEFKNLTERVFGPIRDGMVISVLSDVPTDIDDDDEKWLEQRKMASEWIPTLRSAFPAATVNFIQYRSVGRNNGNLPEKCAMNLNTSDIWSDDFNNTDFSRVLEVSDIIYAPTRYSTTAPLKSSAEKFHFRAATMPGFTMAMADALRVDYTEVNRHVMLLKNLLDNASGALASFTSSGETWKFHMDLRHRKAHASGGILNTGWVAGNLPSGEAYIVPYEGEIEGDPSFTRGFLPVQFGSEVVIYRIENNTAVAVISSGPESEREGALIREEVAYANIAELGLGVLADFGIKPAGEILLDEKLGLHIAFGRSEHFGGMVGPDKFTSPDKVIHIDRVYIPETQPLVKLNYLVLEMESGAEVTLMENGGWLPNIF